MATIEERFCHDDADCSPQQYCYHVSERCVDYTQCSRYNRQENHEKRSRHPSQCGPCLSGYTAEELGTGEMAWLCKKTNGQQNIPGGAGWSSTTITCTAVGGVLFCILVFLTGVYLRKRVLKRRGSKPEQCGDLCVMEPSAPPVESSPFIGYGEELSHVPINNNKNLKDKNNLVRAAGFKPPSWIRTNPNYENNLNNDNMTAMGQLQSVSEIPPIDDHRSIAWPQEQLIEANNDNVFEIEQANNNTSTILSIQTDAANSSTNSNEEGNSSSTSNNNARNGERIRSPNILIQQKISMNLNLLNND